MTWIAVLAPSIVAQGSVSLDGVEGPARLLQPRREVLGRESLGMLASLASDDELRLVWDTDRPDDRWLNYRSTLIDLGGMAGTIPQSDIGQARRIVSRSGIILPGRLCRLSKLVPQPIVVLTGDVPRLDAALWICRDADIEVRAVDLDLAD